MYFIAQLLREKEQYYCFNDDELQYIQTYGMIPELVGRLPIISTLDILDESDLLRVLTEPKNSIIKQYQKLFLLEGVLLEFQDNAL